MPESRFPDPETASPEGIVALGGDLSPETLLDAYSHGIFPWPIRGLPLAWFCPPRRAILEFSRLHLPRSLARARRKSAFAFSFDRAFERVIVACSQAPRPGQDGTWITPSMRRAYCELHLAGHAHSVEVWEGNELAGGLYGVETDGVFAGESMFHLKPNASKLALLHLVEHLRSRGGADWMDIQVMTPHMESLGAIEISRAEFLARLGRARSRARSLGLRLFSS